MAETTGGLIYDHAAVALCRQCGDPIEADCDGEFFHVGEYTERSFSPHDDLPAGVSEKGDLLSYQEMLTEVKQGRAIVIQGIYTQKLIPTQAEAEFLEVFFPDA